MKPMDIKINRFVNFKTGEVVLSVFDTSPVIGFVKTDKTDEELKKNN